jgi:hypothetical protein
MKRLLLYAPLAVGLAIVVALSGCGGSGSATSRITGKVIYKGTPLPGGNVVLTSSGGGGDGGGYPSPIQMDGTYLITNIPPGVYDVTVETDTVNPDRGKDTKGKAKVEPGAAPKGVSDKVNSEYAAAMAKFGGGGGGGGGGGEAGGFGAAPREELLKRYTKIPEKYANKKTSNLRIEVDSGKNNKDITLD